MSRKFESMNLYKQNTKPSTPVKPIRAKFIYMLLLLSLFGISHTFAADQLRVGIAKRNITPSSEVKNWVTGKPYRVIKDSIFVRSLVLMDSLNNTSVIISWDLVDASESATEEIRKRISEFAKIPMKNILVNATHNHSAPWSPVYNQGFRGRENETWWTSRHIENINSDPHFSAWKQELVDKTLAATKEAMKSVQPASIWVGRVDASEFMNNRRPRAAKWGVEDSNTPVGYNYKHKEWNPKVLMGAATFGPMDRAMSLVSFRNKEGRNIATIFHLAIHAVAIYPYSDDISGDWPSAAASSMNKKLGGESIFLQGAAGDINPWRRGPDAVKQMATGLVDLAALAFNYSAKISISPLQTYQRKVSLPTSDRGKSRTGLEAIEAEVQVITMGPLAIVALPGEPLTSLADEIRKNSPFPQTLVLGYSNGNGVHYVCLPDEEPHGGYEVEEGTSGSHVAGLELVETANQMLKEARADRNIKN